MKTYEIYLVTNDGVHFIKMDLRPTEAKLLGRVSSLLGDAVLDHASPHLCGELTIVEA